MGVFCCHSPRLLLRVPETCSLKLSRAPDPHGPEQTRFESEHYLRKGSFAQQALMGPGRGSGRGPPSKHSALGLEGP